MNEQISFSVQGSTSIYEVVFSRGDDVSATCTCNAGQMGQHCKHRLSILAGDGAAITSENKALVADILAWLPGTKLAGAFAEMVNAEGAAEQAKKRLAAAKKAFARAMLPQE